MRTDLGWTLDPAWTFLNHGSFGACPGVVLEAQAEWRRRLERQPVRFLDRELPTLLAWVRERLGAFLGADPDGLAFVPNATTGVNSVLRSLSLRPGDELLTDDHEYNATINAMRAVAAPAGARVVVAAIPMQLADETTVLDAIVGRMTERTRLLVISHVTSPTALVFPVEQLVAAAGARGIDTLVDAAHAPGMLPLALDELRAAYVTGNTHKWLCAPKGSGFLWVRADRREATHAPITSHGANDQRPGIPSYRKEFDWMGTADPTATLSIPAALDALAALDPGGWPAIMAAAHDRAVVAGERIAAAVEESLLAPPSMLGAMAAVPLPIDPDQRAALVVKDRLEAARIEIPVVPFPVPAARPAPTDPPGAVLLRVSTPPYVDEADIDRLVGALPFALAGLAPAG